MNSYQTWGWLLVAVAAITIGLTVHRYRRGLITTLQFGVAMIARLAFLFLGVVYVTELIVRYPRLPLAGLFVVGLGIFLNLAVNTWERVRRDRARSRVELPDE